MKNKVYKALLLTLIVLMPVSAMADVRVHVNIPLPLPIVFPSPPHLVVIPDTDVYAVADIGEDIFFHAGWWWRPWNNRWYRSRYYDRDWAYHPYQPSFQRYVPADWRRNYRHKTWNGYRWEPQRRPYQDIQRNWHVWEKNRHWDKQSYGVKKITKRAPAPQYRSNTRPAMTKPAMQHNVKSRGDFRTSERRDRR